MSESQKSNVVSLIPTALTSLVSAIAQVRSIVKLSSYGSRGVSGGRFKQLLFVLLAASLYSGCDSFSENEEPVAGSISADKMSLTFHPSRPLPMVTLSVDARDPDDDQLSFEWHASGGHFEVTGFSTASLNNSDRSLKWSPDPQAGDYKITVSVSDGSSSNEASVNIEVVPDPTGYWSGAIELTGEEYEQASYCMWFSSPKTFESYTYSEQKPPDSSGHIGHGSEGVAIDASYSYPTLTALLDQSDSDSYDEPVYLEGKLSSNGERFEIKLRMESNKQRIIPLGRSSSGCW